MRRKELFRTKPELPLSLRLIRGAIGKEYVIKHYSYGAIKTKYPDMTKIIASVKQRSCRNLFQKAVAYAKEVIADPVQKAAWQKRLRRYNGVYNDAIKAFMLKDKRDKERADLLTDRLIRQAFKDQPCIKKDSVLPGLRKPEKSLYLNKTPLPIQRRAGPDDPVGWGVTRRVL